MNRQRKTMKSPLLHTLALAATLLTPAVMTAQVDRTKAPPAGPAPEVHLGEHKSFLLDNGMRVIIVENHKIPIVTAQVRFDIPPIMQGDIAGYQDLVGELLTSGTARHSKEQIDELVDGLGAQLAGSNDGIYASSLKRNFTQVMDLLYEVVSSANFPNDEFEKAKTRMMSQIGARADDPDQIASVVGHALTFGKNYPHGEVTTEATMGKADRDDVYQYYRYFFQPKQGYLVLVGDITAKEGEAMAKKYFGTWKGAEVPVTKDEQGHDVVKDLGPIIPAGAQPRLPKDVRVAFVDRPGSAQSVIKVLFPVDLKPNDPMATQAQVLNTILGGGVFNARLMQNLREDKGYTYGAYSSLDADRWCGSFSAGCSVRNDVTDSAAVQIMDEITKIRTSPVTADELSLAKNNMAGSFARALEDPRTVARFALNTYLNDLPEDHYETYLKRLDKVTVADVQKAAERFMHPDSATILVVGDKEQVAEKLKPLSTIGRVFLYDVNGDIVREDRTEGATPAPAGMTAQVVMDAYIKAIGGKAVEKVKDLKKEYTTKVQGMDATMTEYNKVPNKYAMEMKMGEMLLQKLVFDGERGKVSGMGGEKELIDTDLDEVRGSAYAFPELHYAEMEQVAKLMGIVDIDGAKAYRLNVKTLAGGQFDEYYDTTSGLKIRKKEFQSQEGAGGFQVITDYADYAPEGGVLFPHTLKQKGGMDMTLTATKISVNQGIADSVFSVE
ncbi:MAG: insulinase family protein [Flavobacteriales bacterium]|nr:insulinase family protein [Flavobacteriales bacterium]MBK9059612.1 insulinase family protein [Flavobacteriales bacterium]MBK9598032.1 insulinase family protein [Flavobacteriales bacterium]QQS73464.1 MAG: insulinase family protein [Flavobacteriales bacterium]HQV39717.1 pitrilysin family protein [Flavobacteriales bacterium]